MKIMLIAACVLPLAASQAWGQSVKNRPDPGDPKAVVAPTLYRSAFDGYRTRTDEKIDSWKGANDNVGRIGGWRVYLKEAGEPDLPATGTAAPTKPASPAIDKPAPAGHGGH